MPLKDNKPYEIYIGTDPNHGNKFRVDSITSTIEAWPAVNVVSRYYEISSIKKVIFNGNCTIVLWEDGTKTVVRAQDDEVFDKEKGLAMAIAKKYFGNKGSYYNNIKKWVEPESEK